jgi:hypothetical protein
VYIIACARARRLSTNPASISIDQSSFDRRTICRQSHATTDRFVILAAMHWRQYTATNGGNGPCSCAAHATSSEQLAQGRTDTVDGPEIGSSRRTVSAWRATWAA